MGGREEDWVVYGEEVEKGEREEEGESGRDTPWRERERGRRKKHSFFPSSPPRSALPFQGGRRPPLSPFPLFFYEVSGKSGIWLSFNTNQISSSILVSRTSGVGEQKERNSVGVFLGCSLLFRDFPGALAAREQLGEARKLDWVTEKAAGQLLDISDQAGRCVSSSKEGEKGNRGVLSIVLDDPFNASDPLFDLHQQT